MVLGPGLASVHLLCLCVLHIRLRLRWQKGKQFFTLWAPTYSITSSFRTRSGVASAAGLRPNKTFPLAPSGLRSTVVTRGRLGKVSKRYDVLSCIFLRD
jgi:hypothetical protein